MKLIIVGLGGLFEEHRLIVEKLQERHEIAYWIYSVDVIPVHKERFPNTIFHEYHAALAGLPAEGLDIKNFAPWGREEIAKFQDCELVLMSMMDKWYPHWPVNRRKDFYYDLLSYWGGVLDLVKPDAIVLHAPPHEMYSYVLYEIARSRGIKTPMFDVALKQDRLIMYRDYKRGNEILAEASKRNWDSANVALDDLSQYMRDYYLEVSQKVDPAPHYVADSKKVHSGLRDLWRRTRALHKFIKDGSIVERAVLRFFKLFKSNAKREHERCQTSVDFSKDYVYVPLHFQPESTTSPQGDIYVDQVLMIKTLSAALPDGWLLYVKEHPAQWLVNGNDYNVQRYPGYYEQLATLPNVRLVSIATNTFQLADRARATATITGTAGWESVLRGKFTLVFGYPYFMHAPGVFRVQSVSQCQKAFQLLQTEKKPSHEALLSHLALLDQVCVQAYLQRDGKKIASYTPEECTINMYTALEDALAL